MKIKHATSHLNGEEYLLIHRGHLYSNLKSLIESTSSFDDLELQFLKEGWHKAEGGYFQTDRVGISRPVQTPNYGEHLVRFVGDQIDVGVEILPMKSLQSRMSSGAAYYEVELYHVVRQGRGVPAVPLVLVGIDA